MTFEEKIRRHITQNHLLQANDQIVVGVSGGIDSVVLLFLLKKFGYRCIVAHCNFHLRGRESDNDENFVANIAKELQCEYHVSHFNTNETAKQRGISIEMAARDLRYAWFEELKRETNSQAIAVAHHANDLAETLLLNITRGTGLRGLATMQAKRGDIIRPLLTVSRDEIETYAQTNGISFRCDSTNASIVYKRNRIRHNVIPELTALNPSFVKTMVDNHAVWSETEKLLEWSIKQAAKEIVCIQGERVILSIPRLLSYPSPRLLLFELLKDFQFNAEVTDQLFETLGNRTGAQFFSPTHCLTVNRDELIVTPRTPKDNEEQIVLNGPNDDFPEWLTVSYGEITTDFVLQKEKATATFDLDRIQWPLTLRHWKEGDTFHPFGMQGTQKVSDYLINSKIDRRTKHSLWILEDAKHILWIVGQRTDKRVMISDKSKRFIKITTTL